MRLWNEIKDVFSERASPADLLDPSRAGARLRHGLLLIRELYRSIRRDDVFNMASALAFKTILALVPVLAISFAVVSTLDATGGRIDEGAGENHATYTYQFVQSIKEKLPTVPGMENVLEQINDFAKNATSIAIGGFLFLFWTAFSLLGSIENGFNHIWQVREQRTWLGKLTAFLATLVIVPVLMVLSVFILQFIQTTVGQVLQNTPAVVDGDWWPQALLNFVLICSALLTTCMAMTALFYLMPFTPVRLRAALAGGLVAGLMFELAKLLFRTYAGHVSANYTQIYGPLLAVPLFLLWVWLVWIFILVGVEISFTVQNFRDLAARAELEKRGITSRLYLAVRIVLRACRYFRVGENPSEFVDRAAEELTVPPYMVREIINALLQKNILRRVVPDVDNFVPAKDINAMTVGEVIEAAQADALDVPSSPDDGMRERLAEIFGKVEDYSDEVLGALTFADLVKLEEESKVASMKPQLSADS